MYDDIISLIFYNRLYIYFLNNQSLCREFKNQILTGIERVYISSCYFQRKSCVADNAADFCDYPELELP